MCLHGQRAISDILSNRTRIGEERPQRVIHCRGANKGKHWIGGIRNDDGPAACCTVARIVGGRIAQRV